MARRVFYSFHYQRDVNRAHIVRNSWVTKPDRETAGFFDSSVFESKQRTSDDALKRFLNDGLVNSSVTCVLIGYETAWRRWVRYELLRSFAEGKGLLGIGVQSLRNFKQPLDPPGVNPLACLGIEIHGQVARFKEYSDRKWIWSTDLPTMPASSIRYNLGGYTDLTFDRMFPVYDWETDRGYENLGAWVEKAARAANR